VTTLPRTEDEIQIVAEVREGEYGGKLAAIEPGGAEFIPLEERVPLKNSDRGRWCGIGEDGLVLLALIYAVVGRLLSLIVVRGRGEASKDVELVLLRHEISVLRRQLPRPRLAPADRLIMAAFARHLPASLRKCPASTLLDSPGLI
jgi:hypothetical protein